MGTKKTVGFKHEVSLADSLAVSTVDDETAEGLLLGLPIGLVQDVASPVPLILDLNGSDSAVGLVPLGGEDDPLSLPVSVGRLLPFEVGL